MVGSATGAATALIVAPVFHLAHFAPVENNAVGGENFEMAGNKTGLGKSFAGDLAFAFAGGGVGPPGHFARGNVFIAGDFGGDPAALHGIDPDDLLKMTAVVADPFALEMGGRRNPVLHIRNVGGKELPATRGAALTGGYPAGQASLAPSDLPLPILVSHSMTEWMSAYAGELGMIRAPGR